MNSLPTRKGRKGRTRREPTLHPYTVEPHPKGVKLPESAYGTKAESISCTLFRVSNGRKKRKLKLGERNFPLNPMKWTKS